MPINVTFDAPPTPPSSSDKTNFRLRYDAFLAYIQSLGVNLITFKTEINDLETNVNTKEASAVAASNIAVALTNYKGLFVQGTSSALVGESWAYGNFIYRCSVNTSNNPVTEPTSWTPLSVGAQIHASAAKTTLADADELGIWDSVSGLLKKITIASLSTIFAKQSQLVGFKNYIINGNFDVWQHGTSFAGLSNSGSTVTADMARYSSANSGQTAAFTVSQSTDAPSGSTYSIQVACTTAQGVLNSADSACVYLPIEGQNAKGLYGKNVSVSFKFKTTLIGTYDIVIATSDRAYVKQITVTDTNWNTYSFSLLLDSSTGTWNRDTSLGFVMSIKLLAGSSRLITANTWASGSGLSGSSGSVNFANSTSNIMKIAQVQIEEGAVATPFEQRAYGLELSLCQRYYEKSATNNEYFSGGRITGTTAMQGVVINFKATKRVAPTITLYSPTDVSGVMTFQGTGSAITGVAMVLDRVSATSAGINSTTLSGMTVGQACYCVGGFTASAEL